MQEITINNTALQVREYNGQRILTTAQVAEQYGTTTEIIKRNFSNNREHYTDGKHYYYLTGDVLRQFKNEVKNLPLVGKNASSLYLWTEKGAFLHAKSLNTPEAWDAYDFLVENYFNQEKKQELPAMSMMEMIAHIANNAVETEKRLTAIETAQAEQNQQIQATNAKITSLHTVFADNLSDTFEDDVKKKVNAICQATGKCHSTVYAELYYTVNKKAGCDIKRRQQNVISRKMKQGYSKTAAINTTSQLTVIAADKTLKNVCQMALNQLCAEYLDY